MYNMYNHYVLQTKNYRNDGYEWKKRKTLSTIVREDRMKLKLAGFQVS